jgi:hypothetical protein
MRRINTTPLPRIPPLFVMTDSTLPLIAAVPFAYLREVTKKVHRQTCQARRGSGPPRDQKSEPPHNCKVYAHSSRGSSPSSQRRELNHRSEVPTSHGCRVVLVVAGAWRLDYQHDRSLASVSARLYRLVQLNRTATAPAFVVEIALPGDTDVFCRLDRFGGNPPVPSRKMGEIRGRPDPPRDARAEIEGTPLRRRG